MGILLGFGLLSSLDNFCAIEDYDAVISYMSKIWRYIGLKLILVRKVYL